MAKKQKITPTRSNGWSELPDDLLNSILLRLIHFPGDLLASSKVCKSWRASATPFMALRPPMLMLQLKTSPGTFQFRNISNPEFRLTRQFKVASKRYVGFSFGHYIFIEQPSQSPTLINPLTGATTRLRLIPLVSKSGHLRILTAVLSANPTSQDCVLLCWGRDKDSEFAFCPVHGHDRWITQRWVYGVVRSAVVTGSKVVVLVRSAVVILDLLLNVLDKMISVKFQYRLTLPERTYYPGLIRLGGELLVMNLYSSRGASPGPFLRVYQPNMQTKWIWEKGDTLDGRALFLSCVGGIVLENPKDLGARENSIYFVCQDKKALVMFSLEEKRYEILSDSLPQLHRPPLMDIPTGIYNWL